MGQRFLDKINPYLRKIRDLQFREAVIQLIMMCPDYITVCPASSTGKYHPTDEVGRGPGMLRHMVRVMNAGQVVCDINNWGNYHRDILIAGAFLHDAFKQGEETDQVDAEDIPLASATHTIPEHPVHIFNLIMGYMNLIGVKDKLSDQWLFDLAHACLLHEGRWTISMAQDLQQDDDMTDITREICEAMHIADMMASRRYFAEAMQYDRLFCADKES